MGRKSVVIHNMDELKATSSWGLTREQMTMVAVETSNI